MFRTVIFLTLLFSGIAWADVNPIIGSYGRIGFTVDGDGGQAERRQITLFGPRVSEGNYLELDLGADGWKVDQSQVKVLTTLSFGDRFAHASGDFSTGIAIRQAFVEAEKIMGTGAFVWLGSRMARGDDIYLLDFWPMDDLNIVGLATGWRTEQSDTQLLVGFNRAIDRYQVQYVDVPDISFGEARVTSLNRQRTVAAVSSERRFTGGQGALATKLRLYGELHFLPSGERTLDGG